MIHFRCEACGTPLKAQDGASGGAGRCPTCGKAFKVPGAAGPGAPPADLVSVKCPHCGVTLRMRAGAVAATGRAVCAACKKAFRVSATPPAARPRPAAPAAKPSAPAPRPRPAAAPSADPAAAPPEKPPGDATVELAGYPWDPPAELAAKAEAYDARNECQPFTAKVNEFLNSLLKNETFRGLVEAELRVYPDLVAVTERPPGCLARLILRLPGPLQSILYWTIGGGLIGLLFLPLTLFLLVLLSPIWVPVMIVEHLRMAYAARRIRQEPTSSYAIRKMHQYAPIGPRYWERGDVVQIVRVDTRRRLLRRSLILFVQDDPLPARGGCLQMGLFLVVHRMLRALRRVYVVNIEAGAEAADAAAAAVGRALALPVGRARFSWNNLAVDQA